MNKTLATILTAGAFIALGSPAHADDVKGGFCQILQTRVSNPQSGLTERKLWDYTAPTLGDAPVMGWIDVACADRGAPRATLQDFGQRIWFNLSGPAGAAADQGKITFTPSRISGEHGNVGLSVRGRTIYGVVTPRHDCTYVVSVWQDHCPSP